MSDRDGGGGDEVLERVERLLDEDLLDEALPMSDEELDGALRSAGINPEVVAHRIREVVEGARVQEREEDEAMPLWQREALRRRRRLVQGGLPARGEQQPGTAPRPLERAELLRWVEQARRHPRLEGRVRAYFRGRAPHEASDEELRGLLEDLEHLRRLSEGSDGRVDDGEDVDGDGHRPGGDG